MLKRSIIFLGSVFAGLIVVGAILVCFVVVTVYPQLPSLEVITDYQPKIPLRVYSAEGELLGEFGVERRTVVKIKQIPELIKQAVLAAEDERFYEHGGTDFIAMARAVIENLRGNRQGAGTITMQVAREFFLQQQFLKREQVISRKINEILLAYKIESNLTKDEILELYLNQINLGQRAYGFAAASHIYFGKTLEQINAAEAAMLAGLPKAPSKYNPVVNPKRAKQRQLYVLGKMRDLNFLSAEQYEAAKAFQLKVRRDQRDPTSHAEYIAEMARQVVFDAYGEGAYERGIQVHTTIRKPDQEAAYAALRKGVMDYDRRHGYRGPETYFVLPDNPADLEEALEKAFADVNDSEDLLAAIVLTTAPGRVEVIRPDGEQITIGADGLKFVQKALTDKVGPSQRIRRGALVRISPHEKGGFQISQLPQVESALVAVDPNSGAIRALIGGFDFYRNKYNHATQAQRQPGSSFKPFIYSAALEKGFSPATIVNDAPLYFDAGATGSQAWEPKNYDGKYEGPIRLRTALMRSKNMVSIRVLQQIGVNYAQDYITRFGFEAKQHPAYLTMALGAGSATPLQMAAAYSIFANGGYRTTPHLIDRIINQKGEVLQQHQPQVAGESAERVIDPRNAFIMSSMMRDVVRGGTAAKAMSLGRTDLAGKTGTTNDHVDAWFCGYNPALVAVAWIGFDQPHNLGAGETGGLAALPIWMGYMGKALKGVPEAPFTPPEGIVTLRVGATTGLGEGEDKPGVAEYFYKEFLPKPREESLAPDGQTEKSNEEIKNQLF